MSKPIIISKVYTEPTHGETRKIVVKAKLSDLHGNEKPYFSITGDYGRWYKHSDRIQVEGSGAVHDEISRAFNGELDDLLALHLSNIDGVPMHAETNGWYWLAGALGGLECEYHGGAHHSPDKCLELFAKHVRINLDQAREIAQATKSVADSYGQLAARKDFTHWINAQHVRWKAAADAVIGKYKLEAAKSN